MGRILIGVRIGGRQRDARREVGGEGGFMSKLALSKHTTTIYLQEVFMGRLYSTNHPLRHKWWPHTIKPTAIIRSARVWFRLHLNELPKDTFFRCSVSECSEEGADDHKLKFTLGSSSTWMVVLLLINNFGTPTPALWTTTDDLHFMTIELWDYSSSLTKEYGKWQW